MPRNPTLRALAVGCLAAALTTPALADVETVLDPFRTREQLTLHIGSAPSRCIELSAGGDACLWQLGNRHSSWKRLARAIETGDRIHVICTLPESGPREAGSCAAYPQRTNRDRFQVAAAAGGKKRRASDSAADRRRAKRDLARQELAAADTLGALIALTGTLPERCVGSSTQDRTCVWQLSNRTLGHGTVAASADVSLRDRVRMDCRFDADDAVRGECRVSVP